MASKKIVVDLDLSGNRINNALVQLLTQQEVSRDTATMAKGAGQLGFYNGTVYRSVLKTSNPDSYQWKALADASVVSSIQASVATMDSAIANLVRFAQDYNTVSEAVSSETEENIEMRLDNDWYLRLYWGNSLLSACQVDMSQFLIDGMLSGAHLIEYSYEGGAASPTYFVDGVQITIGTTVVDGKKVTNNESGFPLPPTSSGLYLRLVFNTDPEQTKTASWVDMSRLIDAYLPGSGIDIDVSNAISVKLKQNQGLGVDANGLFVNVDGTSVTFDNQGRLKASTRILSLTGRAMISEGEVDVPVGADAKILEARLMDLNGYEIVCEKAVQIDDVGGEVYFAWNVGDYVAPSPLTDADYYYYEVYYV